MYAKHLYIFFIYKKSYVNCLFYFVHLHCVNRYNFQQKKPTFAIKCPTFQLIPYSLQCTNYKFRDKIAGTRKFIVIFVYFLTH